MSNATNFIFIHVSHTDCIKQVCAFILKVVALVYCCCVNVWQLLVQCVCAWASIAAGGLQLRFLQPEKLQDPPCESGAGRVCIYSLFIIKVMQEAAAASCERSSSLTCEASGQNLWKVWLLLFFFILYSPETIQMFNMASGWREETSPTLRTS